MKLSQQLYESTLQKKANKIVLKPGYLATVKTKNGQIVVKGRITEIDKNLGVVRITDASSGTSVQIDVDIDRYDIWIKMPGENQKRNPQAHAVNIRPSQPGIYYSPRL